jgi:GNAT superfamily N-acetyltransferase
MHPSAPKQTDIVHCINNRTFRQKDISLRQGEGMSFLYGKVLYYGFKVYYIMQTSKNLSLRYMDIINIIFEGICMEYIPISTQNRQQISAFITDHWFSTRMIIRGEIIDMTQVDGIIAMNDDEIIGLLTYIITDGTCEITSLNSLKEGNGIGTALVNKVISIAKEEKCNRIIVVTTNDNINAIRFYQKRGFDMARLYHNALDVSRKLKPEIPLIGENKIPLKHEIEFEIIFAQ